MINVILIRKDGLTMTFQSTDWADAINKAADALDDLWAVDSPVVKVFGSKLGDERGLQDLSSIVLTEEEK